MHTYKVTEYNSRFAFFNTKTCWHTLAFFLTFFVACVSHASLSRTDYLITQDGQPRATIIIATNATRAASLAAYELQYHIKLISGAELPITDVVPPDLNEKTRIYIGACGPAIKLSPWKFMEYAILWGSEGIVLAGQDKEDYGEVRYDPETGDTPLGDLPGIYDPQGTLHAVYRFLEDVCGVRWWNATDSGLVFPKKPTLVVSGEDMRRQPDFHFRSYIPRPSWAWLNVLSQCFWPPHSPEFVSFLSAAYPEDMVDQPLPTDASSTPTKNYLFTHPSVLKSVANKNYRWLLRQRLGGSTEFHATHSLKSFFYRFGEKRKGLEEYFAANHPDWFAKGHEDLPNQLCYSNEEVVQQVVRDARAFFDGAMPARILKESGAIPGSDYFPLAPNDGWGYCKCKNCFPLWDMDEANHNPFFATGMHSDYWFGFVNRVARELKRTHPDKVIATLAYASYARPPTFPLEDNVAVQFCHAIRDPYDTATWNNEEDLLTGWAEKLPAERRFLWLYYCFPREFAGKSKWRHHVFPAFFAHEIGRSFKHYRELGYQGAFFNGWAEDIDTVITLKMLNDTSVSVDTVLEDYFTSYYGEAAVPMAKLYAMIEELYCNPANYPHEREGGRVGHQSEEMAWGLLGTHDNMQTMRELMERARKSASTPATRHRVDLFDKGVWSYMEEGRRKYEKRIARRLTSRSCRVPWLRSPSDDPHFWSEAFALPDWYSPYGEPIFHLPLLRVAHDGETLFVRYDDLHRMHQRGKQISWTDASLRLLLVPARNSPFAVITIDPDGNVDIRWLGSQGKTSHHHVDVLTTGWHATDQGRKLELSLPLAQLGLSPGDTLGFNVARQGETADDIAVWNVTGGTFVDASTTGQLILDGEDALPCVPMPAEQLSAIQDEGLVGQWTFDGDAGDAIARDSSGNGHDGQIMGVDSDDAQRVPGLSGTGLQLSGNPSGSVEIPYFPALNIDSSPFSAEIWVCFHPLMLGGNELQGILSGNGFVLVNRRNGTRLSFNMADTKGKAFQINTQAFPREANSIAPGQWTQLVVVWDGRFMRCYMNGRPHGAPLPFIGPVQSGKEPLRIGKREKGRAFRGIIDNVSLYRRAFSPEEVAGRFRAGVTEENKTSNKLKGLNSNDI